MRLLSNLLLDLHRNIPRKFESFFILRHIQECLIDADRFNQICILQEDIMHLTADLLIPFELRFDDFQEGA